MINRIKNKISVALSLLILSSGSTFDGFFGNKVFGFNDLKTGENQVKFSSSVNSDVDLDASKNGNVKVGKSFNKERSLDDFRASEQSRKSLNVEEINSGQNIGGSLNKSQDPSLGKQVSLHSEELNRQNFSENSNEKYRNSYSVDLQKNIKKDDDVLSEDQNLDIGLKKGLSPKEKVVAGVGIGLGGAVIASLAIGLGFGLRKTASPDLDSGNRFFMSSLNELLSSCSEYNNQGGESGNRSDLKKLIEDKMDKVGIKPDKFDSLLIYSKIVKTVEKDKLPLNLKDLNVALDKIQIDPNSNKIKQQVLLSSNDGEQQGQILENVNQVQLHVGQEPSVPAVVDRENNKSTAVHEKSVVNPNLLPEDSQPSDPFSNSMLSINPNKAPLPDQLPTQAPKVVVSSDPANQSKANVSIKQTIGSNIDKLNVDLSSNPQNAQFSGQQNTPSVPDVKKFSDDKIEQMKAKRNYNECCKVILPENQITYPIKDDILNEKVGSFGLGPEQTVQDLFDSVHDLMINPEDYSASFSSVAILRTLIRLLLKGERVLTKDNKSEVIISDDNFNSVFEKAIIKNKWKDHALNHINSGDMNVIFTGDIHGGQPELYALVSYFLNEYEKTNGNVMICFTGDYDGGFYSGYVYYIIAAMQILFPDNVVVLRGNHENNLDWNYFSGSSKDIFKMYSLSLSYAATFGPAGSSDRIFARHAGGGGLSKEYLHHYNINLDDFMKGFDSNDERLNLTDWALFWNDLPWDSIKYNNDGRFGSVVVDGFPCIGLNGRGLPEEAPYVDIDDICKDLQDKGCRFLVFGHEHNKVGQSVLYESFKTGKIFNLFCTTASLKRINEMDLVEGLPCCSLIYNPKNKPEEMCQYIRLDEMIGKFPVVNITRN